MSASVLIFEMGEDSSEIVGYVLIIFFAVLGPLSLAIGISLIRARHKKKLSYISTNSSKLTVSYDDSSSVNYNVEDIKKHRLGVHMEGAEIIFKDDTKLRHLERLTYWPVLREWLKSKLETYSAK